MVTMTAIIAMLCTIIFLCGLVMNYFAKEHNTHYVMMDDIIDENERLKRINDEQSKYIKELERGNALLYMQVRSMTKIVEDKED